MNRLRNLFDRLNPRVRMAAAGLLVVASFLAWTLVPRWAMIAPWMQRLTAGTPLALLLAAAVIVAVLRWAMGKPARLMTVAVAYWALFHLVFNSRWMPYYAQATYLFVQVFFHLAAIGLLLLLDPLESLLQRGWRHPKAARLHRAPVRWLGVAFLFWLFTWLVRPGVFAGWSDALLDRLFLVALVLPLLGAGLRRRYAARPPAYAAGLVLSVLAIEVGIVASPWPVNTVNLALAPLYLALWAHAYLEEIVLQVRRWTSVAQGSPTLSRLAAWWTPVAERPVPQAPAPVDLAALDMVKRRAAAVPGVVKGWSQRGAGAVRRYQRWLQAGAYVVAAGAIIAWAVPKIYQRFYVTVSEFSPQGEVSRKTVIRITFSDAVRPLQGDPAKTNCFKITPPLEGVYRQEGPKTIVFYPNEPLKPSTKYRVRFDGSAITSSAKRIQSSAEIAFNTPYIEVTDAKLFYSYDLVTNEERQLTGEVNFNLPVSIDELRKNLRVLKGSDENVPVELEKSHVPTRFYFKTAAIQRAKEEQQMTLVLAKGLRCIGGDAGLRNEVRKGLVLPSKVKLEVAETKLWHEPGNTLISVLFNMPVSQNQIQSHLSVTPAVSYRIETEYCYAVLRGDFKPNVSYKITIEKGLTAKSGDVLEQKSEQFITINDLPSKVEFAHRGNILALSGPKAIAVKTMNLDKVHVEIQKVFRNNLIQFLGNEQYAPMSGEVYNGDYAIDEGQINEELTQYIGLDAFHKAPFKGLFSIRLRDANRYESQDWGWFLCTDLGILAKHSGEDLIVHVFSVETLAPQAGATVQLYADNNQVIDKQVTDGSGRVVFPHWRKNEYKFRPQFLVVQKDDDFSFLYFNRTELNQHQFAVGGDAYGGEGVEAFMTPERGVYRPGEKAYVTTVIRADDGSVVAPMPFKFRVRDPRGASVQEEDRTPNANGVMTFTVPFAGDALTGHYSVELMRLDKTEVVGTTSLKVEEFIPDKLKVEVETPKTPVAAGQPLTFKVRARQMFGPPAASHKVSTTVRFIGREFSHPAFAGYTFADPTRSFEEDTQELGDDTLDAQGQKEYSLEVPRGNVPSALKAYVYTEVFDSGGRPVSAAGFADIHTYERYLGLKVQGATQGLRVHDKVRIDLAAISPDGKLQNEDNVRLVVKRKAWYSIFRRSAWGRSGYQSSSYEELIENKTISIKGRGVFEFEPQQAGEYGVFLVSQSGMRSGISLDVLGAGYETMNLESPEKLKIVPDKEAYEVGDKARFLIQTPFTGKLMVTLEREKVYETRIVEVTGHETSVSFDVDARHLPNMYVVGVLLRTPDEERKTLPMVSFGIAPLNVKTSTKRIAMSWEAPKAVQSSTGLDIALQVGGDAAATDVVLAVVDQGILQITNFKTPSALEFFYRKRGLTTQSYSIFDLVLPDLRAKKVAIGGDEGGAFNRRHLNPIAAKKKKSMAVFSGLLKPDASGRVRYHVDTKGFNGEVRVMALAIRGDRYGAFERAVEVADPIVLMPSYPRFVAPGDQFQIPVELYNKTGAPATIKTILRVKGPVRVSGDPVKTVQLGVGDQQKLMFFAEAAQDAGVATIQIDATAGAFRSNQTDELAVRPATTLVTRVQQGELKPGESATLSVPGGFIPFGQTVRMTVSNNPLIRFLRSLDYLIQYPYGCSEQITSQIFPLIYFKSLGYATGRFGDKANAVDLFIQEGLTQLEKRQLPDGQFTLWPGGSAAYPWVSHYVAHCLLEAKSEGYRVNPTVLSRITSMLSQGSVVPRNEGRLDRRTHNTNTVMDVYLLFLKTLVGAPDTESMSALAQTDRLRGLGEVDRSLLSMAYSRMGDKSTGERLLAPDFKSRFLYREQFGSYNSPVRNTAMYLAALADANPQSAKVGEIVEYLAGRLVDGHFGNTQEDAWTFTALAKVFRAFEAPIQLDLSVNGQPYKTVNGRESVMADNALSGKKLTVKNTGGNKAYYYLLAEGTPLEKPSSAESKGLEIERTYLDKSGQPANLSNVVQGDLLVVSLTVRPKEPLHNVVIVDLLPAGLEIENPRLTSRGQLDFEPRSDFGSAYQDIRDDRILLFADELSNERHFSYSVRAVTPGHFVVPNAYAEAMYDPEIHGRSHEPRPMVVVENNGK